MDIRVSNMEYDIDKLVTEMDFKSNELKTISKNVMLTNKEIDVLNRYNINYSTCTTLKEILFAIEDVLSDMDIAEDELEDISQSIAERDYYQNTNK